MRILAIINDKLIKSMKYRKKNSQYIVYYEK